MAGLNLWLGFGNILCGVLFVALGLPLLRGKVKRNNFYGVRFAAAMKSDETWDRWNRIGGRYLVIWGAVIAGLGFICLVFPPLAGLWIWFFGLAPLLSVIGCVQTYLAGNRSD